jgi:hypothetical protein
MVERKSNLLYVLLLPECTVDVIATSGILFPINKKVFDVFILFIISREFFISYLMLSEILLLITHLVFRCQKQYLSI